MNEESKLGWTSAKLEETFQQTAKRLGGNREAVRYLIKEYKYGEKPRFIRDWCVVDSRRSSNTMGHPTMVFYVPTGGSFLTDIPFETQARNLKKHYEEMNEICVKQLTRNGRIMAHEDCVKITPPQEYLEREASRKGGKENMVKEKLKEIGHVLRQQVVGDFHVAEVQQGAIRGTIVSFIPTAGWSSCTPDESFEQIALSLESDGSAAWKLFVQMVEPNTLLETIRRGQKNYPGLGGVAKALVRQYGCDQASALRLQFSMLGLSRYEFIRDWCVVDMSPVVNVAVKERSTLVYYVPELEAASMDMSYEMYVHAVKSSPEEDAKLIEKILVGETRSEMTEEDIRKEKHLKGVRLIEDLCERWGSDVPSMVKEGHFDRYTRVRGWYIVDVRKLNVHAPTMILPIPGAEWVLSEMEFEPCVNALMEADDETYGRWLKGFKAMSRDDRRYRTIEPFRFK
jgi:hypothetical protein